MLAGPALTGLVMSFFASTTASTVRSVPAAFRLFRSKYGPMDPTGAPLAGGRWNEKGVPVVYASSTLSLSCLEILVHIREPRLPADYVWVQIDIPAELIGNHWR